MNKKWNPIKILLIAAAFIVTGEGCISLTPDNFVPRSIAPVGNDQRIDGSVNVQAYVPEISEGKSGLFENGKMQAVREYIPPESRGRVALFHGSKLKVVLEKATVQKGLFQRVEQGDADYVLDVWVVNAVHELKILGEGYVIDMTAIWRLTRVKDGKVIFCDFVNGHGAAHAVGTNAYVLSLEAATREMIQKGLLDLSDRSTEHLAAKSVAGNRPSMGPAVPEGFAKWSGDVRQNWPKLRMGLPIDAVEAFIGPAITSGAIVKFNTKGYTQEYETSIYTLVFINGKLSRWELR